MVKGDDAFGSGAGKMRRGTFVVAMVSAPTVPTRTRVVLRSGGLKVRLAQVDGVGEFKGEGRWQSLW